jgi:hypothetical protein
MALSDRYWIHKKGRGLYTIHNVLCERDRETETEREREETQAEPFAFGVPLLAWVDALLPGGREARGDDVDAGGLGRGLCTAVIDGEAGRTLGSGVDVGDAVLGTAAAPRARPNGGLAAEFATELTPRNIKPLEAVFGVSPEIPEIGRVRTIFDGVCAVRREVDAALGGRVLTGVRGAITDVDAVVGDIERVLSQPAVFVALSVAVAGEAVGGGAGAAEEGGGPGKAAAGARVVAGVAGVDASTGGFNTRTGAASKSEAGRAGRVVFGGARPRVAGIAEASAVASVE